MTEHFRKAFQPRAIAAWAVIIWRIGGHISTAQTFAGMFHWMIPIFDWIRHSDYSLWGAILWLTGVVFWPEISRPFKREPAPVATRGGITMAMCGQGKKLNCGTPGNGSFEFKIGGRPRKLFFEQAMQMVSEDNLQVSVRVGSHRLKIERFTDQGFVVNDQGKVIGFEVWVLDWIPAELPKS